MRGIRSIGGPGRSKRRVPTLFALMPAHCQADASRSRRAHRSAHSLARGRGILIPRQSPGRRALSSELCSRSRPVPELTSPRLEDPRSGYRLRRRPIYLLCTSLILYSISAATSTSFPSSAMPMLSRCVLSYASTTSPGRAPSLAQLVLRLHASPPLLPDLIRQLSRPATPLPTPLPR